MQSTIVSVNEQPELPASRQGKNSNQILWRIVFWMLVIVVTNVLLLLLMNNLASQIREPVVLENFNNSTLSDWKLWGDPAIVDGVLQMKPGANALLSDRLRNLSFFIRVRFPVDGHATISYRLSDMGNYAILLEEKGVSLTRTANGTSSVVARSLVPVHARTWITVHVIAIDNRHEISVDDTPILDVIDINPFPPGGIALGYTGSTEGIGEYDDLQIRGDRDLSVNEPGL
jgi:hypothetical protein